MHPLESYLEELNAIRSSGAVTKETSGYPALANLLNAAGALLKPKVRCFVHPRNSGAGNPDGGFFTQEQWKQQRTEEPLGATLPARGVIEVKGVDEEIRNVADTRQVQEYAARYGLLLLTNFRDFLLLKRGKGGKPVPLETFHLADSEDSFWKAAGIPARRRTCRRRFIRPEAGPAHGANSSSRRGVFIACMPATPARVEPSAICRPWPRSHRARKALGIFEAEKGEHFFRSHWSDAVLRRFPRGSSGAKKTRCTKRI